MPDNVMTRLGIACGCSIVSSRGYVAFADPASDVGIDPLGTAFSRSGL
jgi:hypothetical protein